VGCLRQPLRQRQRDVAALRERVRTPVDVPTAPLFDKAA
jgi:hypothetical protein